MFDTYVTIVGNVLTAPEWRRTSQSNTLVANFKVASTARRLDRDSGRWVDGNSLRVRVNCWRKLAEGVAASVMVGDPVVVCGRLYTRDWTDDAGNHRTLYELEAVAVGHDLSRGRARFLRNRPSLTTSTVEDAEAESRVHGEPTEPVPAGHEPVLPVDRSLDDDFELPDYAALRTSPFVDDPMAGEGPAIGDFSSSDDFSPSGGVPPTSGAIGPGDAPTGFDVESGRPPEGDDNGNDADLDDELEPVPDDGPPEPVPTGRGRRGRGRVPQPA
ncbi:single-stranded DNA-binding protein [Micromonospora sp. NPDC049044]|uniref:single-stranded DNA-binding protein n=1 Tax=Micromonospora sp. NPDC049044 TaxID=3154827 RepID=UPI0033EE52FD